MQRLLLAEREAVDRERQALLSRIDELQTQLATADHTIRVQARQIADRDEMIAALNVSVEDARAEARAWERAANPGFFGSVVRNVPGVLTGVAVAVGVLVVI